MTPPEQGFWDREQEIALKLDGGGWRKISPDNAEEGVGCSE